VEESLRREGQSQWTRKRRIITRALTSIYQDEE
jgi:hypothetical protein